MNKAVSESICDQVTRRHKIPGVLSTLMPDQVETPEQAAVVAAALHAIHDHAVVVDDIGAKRQAQVWNLQLVERMVKAGWVDAQIDTLALELRHLSVDSRRVRLDTVSALQACFQ